MQQMQNNVMTICSDMQAESQAKSDEAAQLHLSEIAALKHDFNAQMAAAAAAVAARGQRHGPATDNSGCGSSRGATTLAGTASKSVKKLGK